MKRRRVRLARRRRAAIVVLLIASAVGVSAAVLIARGDRTPRPTHTPARHARYVPPTTAPTVAESTPATAPEPTPAENAATAAPAAAARLAIIIDDCGQWPDTERGFIALPVALTLSVLPYVRYGPQIARDADAAGKGVMMHLPMEPRSGIDPGAGRVTIAMDDEAIAKAVRDDLAAVPLAAGVNNHEGSRATADDRVMRDVAAVLAERHVFFIDSRTSAATVAERETSAAGVPTARRDVFLDDVAEVVATESQLRRAAALAKAHGSAIAIGHPRPTTLLAVRSLLPELAGAGVTLVLARDLVH
jgi:uncharacterized protein